MAGTITFAFKGGKELERKLAKLADPKRIRSAARSALRKGADEIIPTAKALVPVDKGDLKRSIKQAAGKKVKVNRGNSRGQIDDYDKVVFQIIGIDQNEQPPREFPKKDGRGTYRDPGVAGVGPITEFGRPEQGVPAKPFMRPAFDARKGRAAVAIRTELGKAIERQAKIIAKKGGA